MPEVMRRRGVRSMLRGAVLFNFMGNVLCVLVVRFPKEADD